MDLAAPDEGVRRFSTTARVRLGDVSPKGRLRLDGIARLIQDVATDDALDGAPGEDVSWVVRSTTIHVDTWPRYREDLRITTWCSGYGPRWATRRTTLAGGEGGAVETESLWIHVDPRTGRPARLSEAFHRHWATGVTDTSVSARRRLPDIPRDVGGGGANGLSASPWPLRFCDFDGLGHVNNAAYWIPVEERLATRDLTPPYVAEIEYREGVKRAEAVEVVTATDDGPPGGLRLWWVVGDQGRASAVAGPQPGPGGNGQATV